VCYFGYKVDHIRNDFLSPENRRFRVYLKNRGKEGYPTGWVMVLFAK
jgi:hypothetical protein